MYNEYFCENDNITQDNSEQNNISEISNESHSNSGSDYQHKKFKGKTIVLVESDNPWYLSKDETIQLPYKKDIRLTNKQYRKDADYGSYENENFNGKIKKTSSINANINMSKNQEQSQNHIIILLIIFLVLLFVYNKYIKNNKE